MKKLLFIFAIIGLTLTSCEKENIEPQETTEDTATLDDGDTTSNDTTTGTPDWDPYDVEHSYYVNFIYGGEYHKNDILDTIYYKNINTGDETLIVVDNQITQHFPDNIIPTYPDSISLMGTPMGSNSQINKIYTTIGLDNTNSGDLIYVRVKFNGIGGGLGCIIHQEYMNPHSPSGIYTSVGSNLYYSDTITVD